MAFQGFLVIGHIPGQPLMVLGAFTTGGPNQQVIEECDNAGVNMQAAIGHSGRVGATSTTFSWRAPSDADGTVDFRYHIKNPEYKVMPPAFVFKYSYHALCL